ncbi:MAG: ammonium transporter [Verrucomicrobiota bacterium]|nr:ammonium transporter [Verrucomicrobiota bacterium]
MTVKNLLKLRTGIVLALALCPSLSHAQTTPALNTGDTAWMLTATGLVLFMTIPGLALFYGGLVRTKNVLTVLMHCFAVTALVTLLWVVAGYSLAFGTSHNVDGVVTLGSFIGDFQNLFLRNVRPETLLKGGTIPESVFLVYQLTFAIITPALIVGAFAERLKFTALLWFSGLWVMLVYVPICHMAWSGPGSLFGGILGTLDFAGGTVVEINSGIASLVACIVVGKRLGYPHTQMMPHNLVLAFVGASMLWVGWFGFNAGGALSANGTAGMAVLVTQIAAAAGALSWMGIEWKRHHKSSVLGIISGAVAGMVAITPAAGYVGVPGALVIGLLAGMICYCFATIVKKKLGYDDTLDVFAVHGIGGLIGHILTGVFAASVFGGVGYAEGITMGKQVLAQLASAGITIVFSGGVTFLILKLVDCTVGLRVSEDAEVRGLDLVLHDENAYNP